MLAMQKPFRKIVQILLDLQLTLNPCSIDVSTGRFQLVENASCSLVAAIALELPDLTQSLPSVELR